MKFCVAGMSVGIRSEEIAVVRGVGWKTSQPGCVPARLRNEVRCAWFDGCRTQYAVPVIFAVVQQGGRQNGHIVCRRKHAGIAWNASVHDTGKRIVNHSFQNTSVGLLFPLGRSGPMFRPWGSNRCVSFPAHQTDSPWQTVAAFVPKWFQWCVAT